MQGRTFLVAHLPSLGTVIAGHGVAGVLFFLTFRHPVLRPTWLPQFYLLLAVVTVLLGAVTRCRRDWQRAVILASVLAVEAVMAIPLGPALEVPAVLASVFVFVAMTEVERLPAAVLCISCAAAASLGHWPLVAWGVPVPGAPPLQAALLALYLLFLAWLAGMVGTRGHLIRRQGEELARIDRTVRALTEANLDFQELATRVQRETEQQERRRITREIHDIVGYTLTNIQMMMEAATDLVRRDRPGLEEILLKSRDQAQRGILETRRAVRNLRAVSEVRAGGLRKVAEAARIFQRATKVDVRLNFGNAPESFGPAIDDAVYRVVQECLTNALRHGNATQITVAFWIVEDVLRLSVTDNGAGAPEIVPGIGLSGMAERVGHAGGSVKAESTPFGFVVRCEVPLGRREGA